jgi:dnd system-associated protein 4
LSYINYGEDVRIRYRREFQGIYQELVGDKGDSIFPGSGELFIFCANLGYKYGKKSKAEKLQDAPTFRFSSMKSELLRTFYLAIGLIGGEGIKLESIENADKLKNIVELYADAGMEIFYDQFLQDYFSQKEGTYYLVTRDSDIEKDLLVYILDQMNSEIMFFE